MQDIAKLESKEITTMSDFVEIKEDKVYTTSRIVAEKFGKEHRHVTEAIETIMKMGCAENSADYFLPDSYIDATNRTYKQYLITEEGAMLLIMGFTGEKALSVKLKFISEFKRMKEYIRQMHRNPIDTVVLSEDPIERCKALMVILEAEAKKQEQLTTQVKQLTSTVKIKDQQLAEAEPKLTYYDTVLQSKDVLPISVIAKDYGKSAIWMNQFLKDKGIQYKQGDIWLLYQKYAEMGLTRTKTSTYNDKNGIEHTKVHTYWTQKGRLFIYDLLKQDKILPLIEQE